jgi:L-fuconolactonase
MTMKIVDSQVHIWYPNTPERRWLRAAPEHRPHRGRSSFVLDDLLAEMKAAEVDRVILTPPFFEGDRNDKAIEAAQLYPDRFAVMGLLALDAPESREKIATWKQQQPGMLGVRLLFIEPDRRKWLSDGTADWFWPVAEKANLGVMIHVSGDMPQVKRIAEQYPGLKLIVDHMGCPRGTKEDAAFAHIGGLCELARFPNIAVKVGALPCYSNEPYPHPNLHQYVKRAYDAFGSKRLFWASDVMRLPCSYSLCKTMITEEMKWLTVSDLEWIMGRGVCEWLGWPLQY